MHKIPTCFFHDLYQNDEFYDSPTYLIVYHDNIWDKGEVWAWGRTTPRFTAQCWKIVYNVSNQKIEYNKKSLISQWERYIVHKWQDDKLKWILLVNLTVSWYYSSGQIFEYSRSGDKQYAIFTAMKVGPNLRPTGSSIRRPLL